MTADLKQWPIDGNQDALQFQQINNNNEVRTMTKFTDPQDTDPNRIPETTITPQLSACDPSESFMVRLAEALGKLAGEWLAKEESTSCKTREIAANGAETRATTASKD